MKASLCVTRMVAKNSNSKKFSFKFYSTGNSIESTIIALEKALKEKPDIIIGTVTSHEALAVAKNLTNKDVLFVVPMASHPDITKISKKSLRMVSNSHVYSDKISDFMVSYFEPKRVLIVENKSQPYSTFYSAQTAKNLRDLNESISIEKFSIISKDMKLSEFIKLVQKSKPQVIYLPLYFENASKLIDSIRDSNFKISVVGHGTLASHKRFFENVTSQNENLIVAYNEMWSGAPIGPYRDLFNRYLYEDCGGAVDPAKVATAFDAVNIVTSNSKISQHFDKKSVLDVLRTSEYKGVLGHTKFSPSGDPERKLYLRIFKKGKSEIHER